MASGRQNAAQCQQLCVSVVGVPGVFLITFAIVVVVRALVGIHHSYDNGI